MVTRGVASIHSSNQGGLILSEPHISVIGNSMCACILHGRYTLVEMSVM